MMGWRSLVCLSLVALVWGTKAYGCAVCGFSKEESRQALLFTTALLTFIPLTLVGGACYFFFRWQKGVDQDHE